MKLKEAEAEERNLEDGWVIMVHEGLEDSYSKVPLSAFNEVWEEQGWEVAHLVNPETGETYSEEERSALANADAEKRAQEKQAEGEAAGAPEQEAATPKQAKKEQ